MKTAADRSSDFSLMQSGQLGGRCRKQPELEIDIGEETVESTTEDQSGGVERENNLSVPVFACAPRQQKM